MPVMNAAGVGVRGRVWRSCIAGFQGLGFIFFWALAMRVFSVNICCFPRAPSIQVIPTLGLKV